MPGDHLLSVIEAIHDAGANAELWPQALRAMADLVGGTGATVEVFDRGSLKHEVFYNQGLPNPLNMDYVDHYAAISPRLPSALRHKPGAIVWDYHALDEAAIAHSPFYMDFLARFDLRYFVGGVLQTVPTEFAAFTVQRTPRHGHVERREIGLMKRLTPHVSQALDVTRRLKLAAATRRELERAVNWLRDGVVLIDAEGCVTYANAEFASIAAAGDGIGIAGGRLEFSGAAARHRFAEACKALQILRDGNPYGGGREFAVMRGSGKPSYMVAVRPLTLRRGVLGCDSAAVAVVLVRDPSNAGHAADRLLREGFGLTPAEADLAHSLWSGVSVSDHARARAVSINTAYTHLRRVKEKTGCSRIAELIRKFNDLGTSPAAD